MSEHIDRFVCYFECGASFKRRDNFIKHLRQLHDLMLPTLPQNPTCQLSSICLFSDCTFMSDKGEEHLLHLHVDHQTSTQPPTIPQYHENFTVELEIVESLQIQQLFAHVPLRSWTSFEILAKFFQESTREEAFTSIVDSLVKLSRYTNISNDVRKFSRIASSFMLTGNRKNLFTKVQDQRDAFTQSNSNDNLMIQQQYEDKLVPEATAVLVSSANSTLVRSSTTIDEEECIEAFNVLNDYTMEEGDQCFDECSLFCDALDNNIEDELPEDRGMVQYEELKLTVNQVDVREAVLAWKSQNSHKATSLLKQDMLYSSIFDLSPMSSTCAKTLFGDNWDLIVKEMAQTQVESIDLTEATYARTLAKSLTKSMKTIADLNGTLKSSRQNARSMQSPFDRRREKRYLRLMKIICDQFSRGRNDFTRIQTEWNYTGNFLMPFFRKLFRDENSLEFLWGEACLKSAAMQQNQKLYDDARRAGGPKIDAIISVSSLQCEVGLIEVSGPPCMTSHTHFLNDKRKIAVNLKRVLNTLRTQYDGGRKEFQQVKVFGIQFYGHTVYVYSLCRPYNGLYLFQVEATFEIPVVPVLFRKKLPKFMYDVAKMKSILLAHLDSIFSYVNSDETDQEISVLSHTSLDLH